MCIQKVTRHFDYPDGASMLIVSTLIATVRSLGGY